MRKYLIAICILGSTLTTAKEVIGVEMSAHTTELSILDSNIARDIFKRLPVKSVYADLVHGLIFKNDRHIFCVREPSRIYHCHFYLKDLGEGELSSYWTDHDYGKGNFEEYIKTSKTKGKAELEFIDGRLHIYTEGKLAQYLYDRMDLGVSTYHKRDDGILYEKRRGRKMKCVKAEAENDDIYACRVFIPVGPDKKKKKPLGPMALAN
ncbi:MAG: hypothetical protein BM556_06235 [Bacteriovorax sp. MedPE-SWde]|nr:MAG: hypothetical protein BM556_06235 [Bacteriovorax sp. MedPE-SWde]